MLELNEKIKCELKAKLSRFNAWLVPLFFNTSNYIFKKTKNKMDYMYLYSKFGSKLAFKLSQAVKQKLVTHFSHEIATFGEVKSSQVKYLKSSKYTFCMCMHAHEYIYQPFLLECINFA